MSSVVIVFASHDGQTRKIADFIAAEIEGLGHKVVPTDLTEKQPDPADLDNAGAIVVAGPIRYGYPLKPVDQFVAAQRERLKAKPFGLLLVNLTARKPGKTSPEGNAYLRKWIKRQDLAPDVAGAIAGRLDYPRYGLFDRVMIQLIMKITGGPTDPSAVVEYTDWAQVKGLAHDIAALAQRG